MVSRMKKIFIESYGCSSSTADAEMMAGLLKQSGYEIVNDLKKNNLNIVVTCTVKKPTENRMIHKITELTKTNKPLIIAGCMTKVQRSLIEKFSPNASLLGPDSIQKIVDVAYATLEGKKVVELKDSREPKLCLPRVVKNPVVRITEISTGCDSACAYCIVRLIKGKLFSYPIDLIVRDVREAVESGSKEVWITSQDNAAYRYENHTLSDVLKRICEIEGKFFVRVGMMNPQHVKVVLDDLIDAYRNEKVFKFLHVPVQSGSDKILKLMKRGYKVKDFVDVVKKFRKSSPQLTLSTDIIVGYPNETEKDFHQTVELVKKMKFDVVNISKFGAREGTESAKMKRLGENVINERSRIMHTLAKNLSLEKNKKWIGWRGEILVDEKVSGAFVGRNFAYKPVVIKTSKNIFGKIVDVKILDATKNILVGKL